MTEITAKIDWPQLLLSIAIAPVVANTALLVVTVIYPPAFALGILVALASVCLGYVTYLILGAPLMIIGQLLGLRHPILHALIGLGAVWLIPVADAAGLPVSAGRGAQENALWFAPLWCLAAAWTYHYIRAQFDPQKEYAA